MRSRLVARDEDRERRAMLDALLFVARFAYPFLIGYALGLVAPR